jgi:hypothetical protein
MASKDRGSRAFDVVVFGATGFTGKEVMRYFSLNYLKVCPALHVPLTLYISIALNQSYFLYCAYTHILKIILNDV